MKLLWTIIAAVLLAGAAAAFFSGSSDSASTRVPSTSPGTMRAPLTPSDSGKPILPSTALAPQDPPTAPIAAPASANATNPAAHSTATASEPTTPVAPAEPSKPEVTNAPLAPANPISPSTALPEVPGASLPNPSAKPDPKTTPLPESPDTTLDGLLGTPAGIDGGPAAPVAPKPAPASDPLPNNAAQKPAAALPDAVVTRADGSILLDGRFVVRGSGTKADPYRLPWDLLIAANETYAPRKGLKTIPSRLSMFNGKYVRLAGFIAFPITATSAREMIVMLNQWDGCCIGMPPTPYDAVEVTLSIPATAAQKASVMGTVVGILHVDPFEDNGWLLGLFTMEDATLNVEE